jgi:hypothetical protein
MPKKLTKKLPMPKAPIKGKMPMKDKMPSKSKMPMKGMY